MLVLGSVRMVETTVGWKKFGELPPKGCQKTVYVDKINYQAQQLVTRISEPSMILKEIYTR